MNMEEQLEVAILGGANHHEIKLLLLHNIIGINDSEENGVIQPVEFNLDIMADAEAKINFRFHRVDIPRLRNALRIHQRIVTYAKNNIDGTTALCMLLRRLSYRNRLVDLEKIFNYSSQSLSQIIRSTANCIVDNHGHLLNNLNSHQWLNRNRYQLYGPTDMGAAVHNCWGFIHGTIRPISRPSINQEEYHYGLKRIHCVKYQSVLTPDGLIINVKGAFRGRTHDAGIFQKTNLYQELEQNSMFPNGENYVLYGDQAYGVRQLLLSPYPGQSANLLLHQIVFNNTMKVLRVAVEWGFQKVVSQFAFVDFKKNQKLLISNLGTLYKCAVALTNCHTWLYGSQIGEYFNIMPPILEAYIA